MEVYTPRFYWDTPQFCCYGFLTDLHTFKMVTLDDSVELAMKKKSNGTKSGDKKVFPIRQCISWPGNARYSAHPVTFSLQTRPNDRWYTSKHCSFSCSVELGSSYRLITLQLSYSLKIDRCLAGWRSSAHGIIFSFYFPIFEILLSLQNTGAWYGVVFIHLLKHFKCL